MAYEVLARKWRPATFASMVGQEHVLQALIHALEADRLHHAYLFTGTRGVGKTTVARILARCLNCERGVGPEPCGVCSSCVEIAEGRFVDLIEVDAASRTRVEDTRELLDNVQYAPTRGRYKVYLIDEVHMLSTSSFNALLKTLEEPPPHVKFLLATTDPKKLPVTVLSRCLQFHLKNLTADRIVGHLEHVLAEEQVAFETPALWSLARAADGSMRDALSLTDQAIAHGGGQLVADDVARMLGTIDQGALERILRALTDQDGSALMSCVDDLAEHAADFAAVLGDLMSALHRIAVAQAIPDAAPRADADALVATIADSAQRMAPEDVQLFYQIALTGLRDLTWAPDPRTGFEMTLLRMLAFRPDTPGGSERPGAAAGRSGGAAAGPAGGGTATSSPVGTSAAGSGVPAPATGETAEAGAGLAAGERTTLRAAAAGRSGRIEPAVDDAVDATTTRSGPRPVATVTQLRPEAREPAAESRAPVRPVPGAAESGAQDRPAGRDGSARDEAVRSEPVGRDPVGRDPVERDPVDRDPVDRDPVGADPGTMDPHATESPAPEPAPALRAPDDWHAVLPRLAIEGMTRALAGHCLPDAVSDQTLDLTLDRRAETLLADIHVTRLAAALEQLLGGSWRVRIQPGEPAGETPTARAERERDTRQQAAEATIAGDPLVQAMIDTFDARVLPGSVRPAD